MIEIMIMMIRIGFSLYNSEDDDDDDEDDNDDNDDD